MVFRKIIILLILILYGLLVSCGLKKVENIQKVSLPEIENPYAIKVCGDKIFISEGPKIFIYSSNDFHLQTSFGKSGKEIDAFMLSPGHSVRFQLSNDEILISSRNKVSFFTKDGQFIKAMSTDRSSTLYKHFGDKFIGQGYSKENDGGYYTINLYDSSFQKIKEIYRVENEYQPGKGQRLFTRRLRFEVDNDEVFITGKSEDLSIDIFNHDVHLVQTLETACKRETFTESHKEQVHHFYKTHPNFSKFFEAIRKDFIYPEFLPAIRSFRIDEDKVFVQTYTFHDGKNDFFVFNRNGEFIKIMSIPFVQRDIMTDYPYTIHAGKLYQLVENKETSNWELLVVTLSL